MLKPRLSDILAIQSSRHLSDRRPSSHTLNYYIMSMLFVSVDLSNCLQYVERPLNDDAAEFG